MIIEKIKKLANPFYYSMAAIAIFTLVLLLFMYFKGNGVFEQRNPIRKIYYADNISPTHQLLIDKFNRLHAGKIEVIPIDLPFEKFSTNERKELLIRYLRSKSDRIDIFSVDQIWVPRFAKWTEPIDKYFTEQQKNILIDQAIKTCFNKNELVAIPLYYDIGLLYYNDYALRKSPKYNLIKKELASFITWERFIEIGKELKFMKVPIYLFPGDDYEGLMCSFIELLGSQNENLIVGDSIHLRTAGAEKSLKLLVDMINESQITPKEVLNFRESECYKKFIRENGLFLRGWSGFHFWYKDIIGPENIFSKYLIAPIPHFKDGKPTSIIGGWNLMLSKYSTKKNEAIEFIKFMVNEESQQTMFENGGYLPINKNVYDNQAFVSKHPELNFYEMVMATGYNRPFLDKYTRCSDVIAHYLNLAMRKQISAKEALATAEKVINAGEFFMK
jgi:multiple sugar transport system substrate-binding protein